MEGEFAAEADLVLDMIGASASGDVFRAGALLQAIVERRPDGDMYPVCCAVASAGRDLLELMAGGRHEGFVWGPPPGAEGTQHPKVLAAQRFLSAFANADTDTCLALYQVAAQVGEAEKFDFLICAVTFVGGLVNAAADRKARGLLPG